MKSAIIYYHNSRKIILTAIGEVLSEFPERNLGKNAEELKEMVVREDLRLNDHIQWIVDASVALKMMIRTYGIKKINNMNGNLGLKYNRLYWEKDLI